MLLALATTKKLYEVEGVGGGVSRPGGGGDTRDACKYSFLSSASSSTTLPPNQAGGKKKLKKRGAQREAQGGGGNTNTLSLFSEASEGGGGEKVLRVRIGQRELSELPMVRGSSSV